MSTDIPLPDDLLHLLEKRSSTDRREEKRRAPESEELDVQENRSGEDRRGGRRRLED
jgi:hypothetical protein